MARLGNEVQTKLAWYKNLKTKRGSYRAQQNSANRAISRSSGTNNSIESVKETITYTSRRDNSLPSLNQTITYQTGCQLPTGVTGNLSHTRDRRKNPHTQHPPSKTSSPICNISPNYSLPVVELNSTNHSQGLPQKTSEGKKGKEELKLKGNKTTWCL